MSHVAWGGSLLVFAGNPGKLIDGTGRFEGASGRVVSNREVPGRDGDSDIAVRITGERG